MVTSSKYIQLTNYALLEYVYNSKVINTRDSSFLRIINVLNNSLNYVSYNPENFVKPKQLTNNTLDNSTQPIDDNRWIHFDIDRPIRFFEQQNKILRFEGVWDDLDSDIDVTYDTVKVHILSGWNSEDSEGFIIRCAYVDKTLNNVVYVANHVYLKNDENIKLNPKPLYLGNRLYDRYIEISIPSLNDLSHANNDLGAIFLTTNENILTQTFDYNNAKLNILFYDIGNYVTENGQVILKTVLPLDNSSNGLIRIDVEPYDNLSQLSATLQESLSGDYFELFPSFQGEFIEDFIYDRVSRYGDSYMVIHDIEVYEQISNFGDYAEIFTQKFTYFQEEGFDKPFKFRPVIENNNAISFTIDYTIRLYNKKTETQVVRKSSLTYPNAKKYGRKMVHLNIDSSFQPMRVVNKIINNDSSVESASFYNYKKYVDSVLSSQGQNVVNYIPFDNKSICINNSTLFVDSINSNIFSDGKTFTNNVTFKEIANSNLIFGQGDAVIYLTEFDNFIKFRIFKHDGTDIVPQLQTSLVGSTTTVFYLVFFNSNGSKIRIEQYSDKSSVNTNLNAGEILFKIKASDSVDILKSADKRFYITFENKIPSQVQGTTVANIKSDFEVVLYNGKVDSMANYKIDSNNEFDLKQKALITLAEQLQKIV